MASWQTSATINGESVTAGGSFRTLVTEKARALNYREFRVLLNGTEIEGSDAPQNVPGGATIEVRPYDKAG